MLRFGIIGAGSIARTHAAALRASDVACLTAVAGGAGAAALAAEEGAATAFAASTHLMSDHRWHQRQIEEFVDALAQGRAPLVDGREGLRSLALVEAVYRSARTGRAVRVANA